MALVRLRRGPSRKIATLLRGRAGDARSIPSSSRPRSTSSCRTMTSPRRLGSKPTSPAVKKNLSIRSFTDNLKCEAYERQQGICPSCEEHFELAQMQADHKTPWSKGGKTVADNCVMLCAVCNRKKWDV